MIGLTPVIDKQSKIPIYQQLYSYIKKQIEAGILGEYVRLPSIRQLSAHLMVSKNTVETAYQQLLAEGYVQTRLRSGMFVLPMETLAQDGNSMRSVPETDGYVQQPMKENLIDFQYGDVELERFPIKVWKKCLMDSLNEKSNEVLGYGDRQGHAGLRSEIARYLYQSRGVLCSPSQVFLSAGTQQSVSLLCQLLSLSERVAMEEPGYNGVRVVFANHGREMIPIPLEHDGLAVEKLRQSGVKVVYVTPSHQFPIGIVMAVQKRGKLLQWAYENDGFIIEDDYDSEFRYQGQPIPALKAMDHGDRVIYLGTFSKSFLPGARLSYIVLPEQLAAAFQSGMQSYSQSVSPLIQMAMHLFMKEGYFEGHVRKMRKLYQSRHKTLVRTIHEQMGNRVGMIGQKSGMHMLLDVYNRNSTELIERASQHGVKIYSPMIHWLDPTKCPMSYVMLGFAGGSEETIRKGILRLRHAWFD